MKMDINVSIRLFMTFVLGKLLHCAGANSQTGNNNYDYNNNNEYNYNYNSYDTGDPAVPPAEDYKYRPISISCFACTLIVMDGHNQGMEHCNDPFNRLDIPAIDCKGPCGKSYHQHGAKDFTITRSCLPNCKEHRDDKSYIQCCSEPYCNTASSTLSINLSLAIGCILLTLCLLTRR